MANTSTGSPTDSANRPIALLWLIVTLVSAMVAGRNLALPHPQTYMTADEAAYGSIAAELATTGQYSAQRIIPDGLWKTDYRYSGHPMLQIYLEAVSVRFLGFSREALRLPSLILLVASSLILYWISCLRFKGLPARLTVLTAFWLCPWLLFAGTTARPEILSSFLVLSACAAAVGFRSRPKTGLFFAGAFSAAAAYNHPIFAGTSCLSFLLASEKYNPRYLRSLLTAIGLWSSGLLAMLIILVGIFILPHLEAWQEQFLGAVKDFGNTKAPIPFAIDILDQFRELRARFPTFGRPYLNWYLGVPLLCLIVLQPGARFWLGAAWLGGWTFYVGSGTLIYMHYCVQFGVGAVVLVLLCQHERPNTAPRSLVAVASLIIFLQAGLNAFHVTEVNSSSKTFGIIEKTIAAQLSDLPSGKKIIGPLEAAMPVLQHNHRYFSNSPILGPAFADRILSLSRLQADYEINEEHQLVTASSER